MKRTKEEIRYEVAHQYNVTVIPVGTKVVPTHNLPKGGYWACPWDGMTPQEESWMRNYGFHILEEEVA